jgi:hypothetical protein
MVDESGDVRKDIRDAVTPHWQLPYSQQLVLKREIVAEALKQVPLPVPHVSPLNY